jgi:hypothetical protein
VLLPSILLCVTRAARTASACSITTVTDSYTKDLACVVVNRITELLDGKAPHLIFSNLRR